MYAEELAVLESLCQERITDPVTPRYVIISPAKNGFGVTLPAQSPD